MLSLNLSVVLHKLGNIYSDELKSCTDLCLYHPLKCGFGVSVLVIYFSMVSDSLLVAHLILFWASRCVIPSVLTPSMAEMMSPWARLPPTALLPGVIYGGGQQERSRLERQQENSSGHTHTHTHTNSKNICRYTNISFIDLADIYECWVHSGRKKRNWISLFTWQFNFFSSHATRLLMLHVCVCVAAQ